MKRSVIYVLISFYFTVNYNLINCFLTNETSVLFGVENNGLIAAFGDFNSDKFVDLFVIGSNGKELSIYLASDNVVPILRPQSSLKCQFGNRMITSVVPGDYDGDSQMDVLVTLRSDREEEEEFRIFWGSLESLNCSSLNPDVLKGTMKGQPLVLDFNGDRIPDLFGETIDKQRKVWIMSPFRNYTVIDVDAGSNRPLKVPHSHTFVDLNSDMTADLLVTTETGFEVWYNQHGQLRYESGIGFDWPKDAAIVGQSVIVDIDMDGIMDHLIPVCFKTDCSNSSILILKSNGWTALEVNFQNSNVQWGFIPPSSITKEDVISLRVGDFDMDGYPDFLAVLKSLSGNERIAVLLQNVESSSASFHRAFSVIWNAPGLQDIKDVSLAAFYDAHNDGVLDILVVRRTANEEWKMLAFRNSYDIMACFIKVIVSSGLCYTDCPTGKIPYGVNQPGPLVCYKSTTADGLQQSSCSGLLSQSAHFALQLPFVIFGLGHTPNFADTLRVGIPYPKGQAKRSYEWTSIIPNSQMFVIPYLESDNNKWFNKLFVTPSHLVLITFGALMGVMGLIFFIVLGLHWKERLEDKKEKLQEAHRFHFDAM